MIGARHRGIVHAGDGHIHPALIGASAAIAHHVVEAFPGGFTCRQVIELANGRVGELASHIQAGKALVAGGIEDPNSPQGIGFRIPVVEDSIELERRVFVEGDAVVEGNRQLVGVARQHRQQIHRCAQVNGLAAGRAIGIEAKAQGAVAHIAIHAIGPTDAEVLDKQDAIAVVADGRTKGVIADGAAVEGGVAGAALEGVVAPPSIHV